MIPGLRHHVPRHVVITGASSGLGAALARAYARPSVHIGLIARRADELAKLQAELAARGAEVWVAALSVTDREALARVLEEKDAANPIDLLIANAGISGGTFGKGESAEQARAIFATNLDGVLNTLHPLLPRMKARRAGQIAIMASIAGFRGLPGAPAYCGSKAAVRVYGEGLRIELAQCGVALSVICPGYVETPMTAGNTFPMPFLMHTDKAVKIIVGGLRRNKARIIFPWQMGIAVWLLSLLPPGWTDGLLARVPRKAAR